MADYYTHFAARLEELIPREAAWLQETFEKWCRTGAYENVPEDNSVFDDVPQRWREQYAYLSAAPFSLYLEDTDLAEHQLATAIMTDDGGNGDLECLAEFVQAFFKEFRKDGQLSMTFARTCSSPRPEGFGGGTMLITATDVETCTGTCLLGDD